MRIIRENDKKGHEEQVSFLLDRTISDASVGASIATRMEVGNA